MGKNLIFVRHSAVEIDVNAPPREWRLSVNGRSLTQQLAPQIASHNPTDTLAIVAHGTVLTLFLSHYNQFAPFLFWQNIQLPDFFVVALLDFTFHDSQFGL